MIGIDTNILLRLVLSDDDPVQYEGGTAFLSKRGRRDDPDL